MKLWALENLVVWKSLQEGHVFRPTREIFFDAHAIRRQEEFLPYDWLCREMNKRVGTPHVGQEYPIYTLFQWEGRRNVDLRRARWWHSCNKKIVRLELECPDDMVLLTDYDMWIYVLNHWYIPTSEADSDRFEKMFPGHPRPIYLSRKYPDQSYQQAVMASWQRIFSLDFENNEVTYPAYSKSIIGWIREIRPEWIISHRIFRGASRRIM